MQALFFKARLRQKPRPCLRIGSGQYLRELICNINILLVMNEEGWERSGLHQPAK